jgi:hypothetical protein
MDGVLKWEGPTHGEKSIVHTMTWHVDVESSVFPAFGALLVMLEIMLNKFVVSLIIVQFIIRMFLIMIKP